MSSTTPSGTPTTDAAAATVRLTVGQALVRFLAHQHTERDGVTQRLFAGAFGIFGHGNVAGFGQGLLQAHVEAAESGVPDCGPHEENARSRCSAAFRLRVWVFFSPSCPSCPSWQSFLGS